jgi:hypothetical protein
LRVPGHLCDLYCDVLLAECAYSEVAVFLVATNDIMAVDLGWLQGLSHEAR